MKKQFLIALMIIEAFVGQIQGAAVAQSATEVQEGKKKALSDLIERVYCHLKYTPLQDASLGSIRIAQDLSLNIQELTEDTIINILNSDGICKPESQQKAAQAIKRMLNSLVVGHTHNRYIKRILEEASSYKTNFLHLSGELEASFRYLLENNFTNQNRLNLLIKAAELSDDKKAGVISFFEDLKQQDSYRLFDFSQSESTLKLEPGSDGVHVQIQGMPALTQFILEIGREFSGQDTWMIIAMMKDYSKVTFKPSNAVIKEVKLMRQVILKCHVKAMIDALWKNNAIENINSAAPNAVATLISNWQEDPTLTYYDDRSLYDDISRN